MFGNYLIENKNNYFVFRCTSFVGQLQFYKRIKNPLKMQIYINGNRFF